MTQLHTLQSQFQDALLQDRPAPDGLLSDRGVAQFGVYRNAYRARLRGALRDNFEVLPLVMGDDAFDVLANAYIGENPSRHYSLRWFGHTLSDFMAAHDSLVDHPAMVDLARMEWALRTAFDAAPAAVCTPAELAAVPPDDWASLLFTLHPSAQLLELQWAIGPVWHALNSGQDEVPPPEALPHHMLVWRQSMTNQWKSLTPIEAAFVQGVFQQRNFGELFVALAAHVGEDAAAPTAVQILGDMLNTGVICAFTVQSANAALA